MQKYFKCLLLFLALPLTFMSCGGDEPDNPYEEEWNEGDQEPTVLDIDAIVRESVSVKGSYDKFTMNFEITSTLSSRLPGKQIRYGIGHDSASPKVNLSVSVEEQAYYFSKKRDGKTDKITFKNPFWYYYIWVDHDGDKLAECQLYYSSFMALDQKGYSHLGKDDKEFYDDLFFLLSKYEKDAKYDYRVKVGVLVDGTWFPVYTYKIP